MFLFSISNHSFRKPASPPPEDRFEVVLPEFVDADCVNKRRIVLTLRAPKRLWIKNIDWVHGPYPSDIKICYSPKNKNHSKLIQRLVYHKKQQKRKFIGRTQHDEERLAQLWSVPILDGELSNQKVLLVC